MIGFFPLPFQFLLHNLGYSFFFLRRRFGGLREFLYVGGKIGRGLWLGVAILVDFEEVGWFFYSFLFFSSVGFLFF